MDDGLGIWPQTRDWLRRSVLEIHVSEYCSYLHGHRYAASTRRVYLCCVAHFAHWMTKGRLPLRSVDEQTVARFLFEHLPRFVRRLVHENRAALAHLLKVLRIAGQSGHDASTRVTLRPSSSASMNIWSEREGSPTTLAGAVSGSFAVS
jgi:integrase/recombinase XerD